VLKQDSEAIVEVGIASTSFAIDAKVGYLSPFILHHPSISNSSSMD